MGFILVKEKVFDLNHETNEFQKKTQTGEVDNKKNKKEQKRSKMNEDSQPVRTDDWMLLTRALCSWTLYTILCKCLFSEVTVQAVTELDNKAAHCHTPVPQWHRPFL